MGSRQYGIDNDRLVEYAKEIKKVVDAGVELAIVIGGGNIFRGVAGADGKELPTPILMNYVSSNDITKENKPDDQKDTVYFSKNTCDTTKAGIDTTQYLNQYGCDSIVITEL